MKQSVAIVWKRGPVKGAVEVAYGRLVAIQSRSNRLISASVPFSCPDRKAARLEITLQDIRVKPGPQATRITVRANRQAFTFFLRDVRRQAPILIRAYGVAVTDAQDPRSYDQIESDIRARGLQSELERIEREPEETYEAACRANRAQYSPIWLGLSRDMRIFRLGYNPKLGYWGYIEAVDHGTVVNAPETKNNPAIYGFSIGRGSACRVDITRRLEDGCLPILHSTQKDDDVRYELTAFATLETRPVTLHTLRGSHWLAAYANAAGQMTTPQEKARMADALEQREVTRREEETVCCLRVTAVNDSAVPRYAWFQGIFQESSGHHDPIARPSLFEKETGFRHHDTGHVFALHRLNGVPMPDEEVAVLLQPRETAVLEILVPHRPISRDRALKLAALNFDRHLDACRAFWRAKLASAAQIEVPEQAVNERIKAGLLHCDLVAYGLEPDGVVAPMIGWYAPIGSESAPIIQFFDAMGWHRLAERSLRFFLERQNPDGFIQNFGGYQLETGPALWTMGEHYRLTRDDRWVRTIRPSLLKACDYLLAWRNRNKKAELRGRGYGLLDGKVADPPDFFHSFMLNAMSYTGIARVSEMLKRTDPIQSRRLAKEAAAFRRDIRTAYRESVARSPVIPAGNGDWVPSFAPWTEYPGPVSLYADGGRWQTHGTFGARDSMIGALYLVIGEILEPCEPAADLLLRAHQELFTLRNAAFSQPYYCRHDYLHIRRGDVKAFLKMYYNQFTALQDREIYTFWEHYFECGQHKTHEEAWFLMQTRWMLWLEEGDRLRLLSGIPRNWLDDGKRIAIRNAASYFGPLSLQVKSSLGGNRIEALIACASGHGPRSVILRVPHVRERRAIRVTGGTYDPERESVTITPFRKRASVTLVFDR